MQKSCKNQNGCGQHSPAENDYCHPGRATSWEEGGDDVDNLPHDCALLMKKTCHTTHQRGMKALGEDRFGAHPWSTL